MPFRLRWPAPPAQHRGHDGAARPRRTQLHCGACERSGTTRNARPFQPSPSMTEQTELSARARAVEMGLLDRLFRLREAGTDTRTELEAGFTTFLTMAYILVVNPQILSEAGVPI